MRAAVWWTGVLMVCCSVWCALSSAGESPTRVDYEERLWALAEARQDQLERTVTVLHDPVLDTFLEKMATALFMHAKTELPPVRIRVLQQVEADARAYPNGVIYLTTGILAHARNQDQLAMIMAHEIIHYTARHALGAFGVLHDGGPANGEGIHRTFAGNPTRRAQQDMALLCAASEEQADREGLALMQAAGYCPAEVTHLMRAFQALDTHNDGGGQAASSGALRSRTALLDVLVAPTAACSASPSAHLNYAASIAPALLANAQSALEAGRWTVAAESIRRYLTVRPDDARALYLRGKARSRIEQDSDGALVDYQEAIDLDRSFAPAYQAIGIIHFKAGRLQLARRYLETSLALAPQARDNAFIEGYLKLCRE